ncbi:hypothetical protein [Salmonella enterica]|uniref:hypothetical protein n=1 Tax=Salmonella enterica TaxID=28901 RepID=UPI002ACDA56F|nr:hypothetical protein [Salmonella enterica]WQG06090.1 hypothetical protein Q1J21_23700 [Salmonella enterica subsp. enterica serovar Abortusovis]WQG10656.1 hypothetical protein Q1J09_24085 [Salmonella enterica subsp. enterica serovar Abortusovis]WQG15057.1 hypothetical protein Q1I83_23215 [Salmonella enterica subsp. enterica serovar Abortusovis]HDN4695303.1 hypothetical protein [Salmonella enterica subsp. enterica serovar Abortusovis]HDN4833158.1 hypothetical protein [Salmonella enterica subs
MKTGKFVRSVCAGMLATGLMLPLSVGAESKQINIQVTIDNKLPTCNINVPGGNTRELGALDRSEKEQTHSAFTIGVYCDGNVKTRMKADATRGAVQGDGKSLAVVMNNNSSMDINSRPLLKLKVDNQFVNLQNKEWFCNASSQGTYQECRITPVTVSNNKTPAGEGTAIDYFL